MASEYKGLYVKFEGDSTSLSKALAEVNQSARKANSTLKQLNAASKIDGRGPKLLADSVRAAGDKAQAAAKKFDLLRQAEGELKNLSEGAKAKMDELARAGQKDSEAYRQAEADAKKYAQQLQDISTKADVAEAHLKAAQKVLWDFERSGTGLDKVSKGLDSWSKKSKDVAQKVGDAGQSLTMGLTLPIIAGATASVKAATDIDTSLTNVRKTTDMTEEGYQKLKEGAIELSKTQPVPATTILDMEALGAQLGWSNDKLQSFAQTVSGLDIATDMDAETAATNLAQFANITGMAQDKASNYASAIVGLGNNMATTESKISDMAQNMASAGTQAGMSQADILGLAAASASLGVEAAAGGTAFSKTVIEIGNEVSTNGKHLKEWTDLAGMSADAFKSAWKSDATGTFEKVIQGMSSAKAQGKDLNVILADLGITETRQSDFLRRLAGNTDLVTKAVSLSNDEWNKNTALQNEVDNRNNSVASKMQVLQNRVTAVAAEVGGPLIDAATEALTAAEPLFEAIESGAKSFTEMSRGEQLAIIKAVGFAAALGPILTVTSKLITVSGGLAKVGSAAASFMNSYSVAAKTASATTLEAAKSVGGLGGKLGALANPATRAAEGTSKLTKAASLAVDVASKLASMAVTLGIALAATAVAEQGAIAIMKLADGYDDAAKKAEQSTEACQKWADQQSQVTAATVDANAAMSASGQSASTLQQGVSDAMATITSTIESNTSQWGGLTAQGIQDIKDALDKLNQAQGETASAYGNAIAAATQKFDHLDSSNVTQYVKDVQGAFDQGKQQLDSTLQQQLQAIEAYHQQVGDVGSDAYNNDVNAAKDSYNKALAQLDDYKSQALQKTSSLYGDLDKTSAEGWQKLDEQTANVKTIAQKWLNNSETGSGAAIQKTKDDFEKLRSTIDQGATGAWMAAQAATVAAGGKLSTSSRQTVMDIINTFDDLPDSLQDEGTESMRALASAVEASGVDLGDVGSMSAQQLVDKMRDVFGKIPDAADTPIDQVISKVNELDGIKLDPKLFKVDDQGTITDENGRVWDFNKQTINGKHYQVNDDGTITIQGTNVKNLDALKVATKGFVVTDGGTANQSKGNVRGLQGQLESTTQRRWQTSVSANTQSARDSVSSLWNSLSSLVSHAWTAVVSVVGGKATGGVWAAHEQPRLHAEGYIADRATWLDSTHRDIVGEAGAEAVIPLTNRAYTKPFAATVASEVVGMLQRGGAVSGGAPTYVINVDGATLNDDTRMREVSIDFMTELMRRADMYA
jgi:TP901 family phage tail tape measure protein